MYLSNFKVQECVCSDTANNQSAVVALCWLCLLLWFFHLQSLFVHVQQLWRLSKLPCSWGKFLLFCFNEGNNTLQLMLMSPSFLARISGRAGIPHLQHQASVIQLCSNIQNYKLSPSASEVPKKKDYKKNKTDWLLRIIVENKHSRGICWPQKLSG